MRFLMFGLFSFVIISIRFEIVHTFVSSCHAPTPAGAKGGGATRN